MNTAAERLGQMAAFGAGGWALENLLFGPRYAALFRGAKVPFLPVYAFGGISIALVAPHLRAAAVPWPVRALVYAGVLSAVEYAGCQIDRRALGSCSWDYSGDACATTVRGCVDAPHAAMWGALGLLVERAVVSPTACRAKHLPGRFLPRREESFRPHSRN